MIAFNSSSYFTDIFYWDWDANPEYDSWEKKHGIDIQTIALHELGHLGGLAHCDTNYTYVNNVLYYGTNADTSKRTLQTYDKNALRLLFGKKLVSPEIPQ